MWGEDPGGRRSAHQNQRFRELLRASGIGLLALSLTAATAVCSPLAGAQELDCTALSKESVDIELADSAHTSRIVRLKAGDTLHFAFATVDGPFGLLTLVDGAGAPRQLLTGPTGTTVQFAAPMTGTYVFQFVKEGEADASFAVSCRPARSVQADRRTAPAASRRAAKLLAENPTLSTLPDPDLTADSIDLNVSPLLPDGSPALTLQQASLFASRHGQVQPPGSLDVWLGADGQRYSLLAPGKAPPSSNAAKLRAGGLDLSLMPQIMVGALVQLDERAGPSLYGPSSLTDLGWMAGPVAKVSLPPGISLEARAAWGEREPEASASEERRLVNARLSATRTFGHWRFSPSIAVNYQEERQSFAYSPADGEFGSHTAGSGRVDIRPELSYRFDLDGAAFIEPRAAIGSFWDIDSLSKLTPGGTEDGARIKAEAGVTVGTPSGTTLRATGVIEEGSAGNADNWSGRFQLNVPLK